MREGEAPESLNADVLNQLGSATNVVAGAAKPRKAERKKEVEPALMTIGNAAARLALSPSMVRKMIGGGQLKAVRLGRSVRLRVEDIDAIVAVER